MPVIVVFTKFDVAVSQVLLGSGGKGPRRDERARTTAYRQYEQSCRSLFLKEAGEAPAAIVSGS